MAVMIPSTINSTVTAGERKVYNLLKSGLPDSCFVYYELLTGKVKPDFIVIMPDKGILILEVKDYRHSSLHRLTKDKWYFNEKRDGLIVDNPFDQARNYAFGISKQLSKVEVLYNKQRGGLLMAYSYGVIFTNLRADAAQNLELDKYIPRNRYLLFEDLNSDKLASRLRAMFDFRNRGISMNPQEVDVMRAALYPETVVSGYVESNLFDMDDLTLMDSYQITFARQLGEGHRRVRGPAGSGKSLILAARITVLKEHHPEWKVLVLTVTSTARQNIRQLVHDFHNKLDILTFHGWLMKDFRGSSDAKIDRLVNAPAHATFPKYDAILIDEGQDFKSEWLTVISRCLNAETGSLLLVEDPVQDVYRRRNSLRADTGLDFRGRSQQLKLNYRNTQQVMELSWNFFQAFCESPANMIEPETVGRQGNLVHIVEHKNPFLESKWLLKEIDSMLSLGAQLGDLLILYRAKRRKNLKYVELLRRTLQEAGISNYWISDNSRSKKHVDFRDKSSLFISNFDDSKGLGFKHVFVLDVGSIPLFVTDDDQAEYLRLYIGMTRATESLTMSFTNRSEVVTWLIGQDNVSVKLLEPEVAK